VYIGPRMNIFLYPYSWISRGVTFLKNRLYRAGVFSAKKPGLKVVSVGNLSLGGTGKTPLVMEVMRHLQAEGLKTALVTRGYKGRWEKNGGLLTDGEHYYGTWEDSGDEPYMVARNIPGAGVFVGRHRLRSCRLAKVKGFAVAVLDDGFQHRKLYRDLDIVLFDPKEKVLREPASSLDRAHLILVPESQAPFHMDLLARRFPKAHIFSFSVVTKGFYKVTGKHTAPLSTDFHGADCLAFCGIGRPERFFGFLQGLGLELAATMVFPDHHPYPESTLDKILEKYRNLKPQLVVTTEKDAVKLAGRTAFLKEAPVHYLKIGIKVEAAFFDQVRKALRAGGRRG
jgi:tetraacyldisaccharide 4'-kinase